MTIKQTYNHFGNQIKSMRKSKNRLLREVAAELEMDQAILSKLENGLIFPNEITIKKFTDYYGLSIEELTNLVYADKILHDYGFYNNLKEVLNLVKDTLIKYNSKKE